MYVASGSEVFVIYVADLTIPLSFLWKMLFILLLIYLLAELTPKLAKLIDGSAAKHKKEKKPEDERLNEVNSAFEPHPDDPKPDRTFFPELNEKKDNESNNKKNRNED